jgi:hypothetical protein
LWKSQILHNLSIVFVWVEVWTQELPNI